MTRIPHGGLDFEYRNLRRALIKLDGTEGRKLARRNARTRVLTSLRKLRAAVDTSYPAIVERSAPRERKSPEQRIKALEKAGWVRRPEASQLVAYAAAGVPIKRLRWKVVTESASPATYVKRKGWVTGKTKNTVTHEVRMIPAWAAAIGPDKPTELRAAKKSMKLRKVALVVEGLR